MEELLIASRPSLRRPVLIAAFRGWNDGGQGASLAGGYLARVWGGARFAEIDPESFFDFQATRPHVSLVEGRTRRIEWPENAFYHARIPGLERDAVLLLGIEPNLRWHASVARDRRGDRPRADRAAGPATVTVRGADGDRRRAARRVQPLQPSVCQP